MSNDDRGANRASYLAEPTIVTLARLLQEIRSGLLVFPRFQRPFVWEPQQRLELLRTVISGLPLGSIMTWRTQREIPTFPELGPWRLPEARATESGRQYILDGLQRLATLYVALTPDKKSTGKKVTEQDPKEMYVHLVTEPPDVRDAGDEVEEDGVGVVVEKAQRALPLTVFNDSRLLLKAQRRLQSLPDADDLIERSDRVADNLKNYKIAVVPFVSDELDAVTQAFQRVNSQGTQMSQLHMVNALTWTQEFSLLDEFAKLKESQLAPLGWGNLDDTVLLRCFAIAAELEAYEFNVDDLAKKLRADHKRAVEVVGKTLGQVALALRRTCHIRTPWLVPYSAQILVVFGAVQGLAPLNKKQRRLISDWIWFTSYVEAFSATTSQSFVSRATKTLRDALQGAAEFRWDHRRSGRRAFPQSFDFRHARARTLALRLAEQYRIASMTPERRGALRAYKCLAEQQAAGVANLVPTEKRASWSQGRGARVVLGSQGDLAMLRSALIGAFDPDLGRKFFISETAWESFRTGKLQEFVRQRGEELESFEAEHFQRVCQRLGMSA